jgi:hypothetical protein
MFVCALRDLTAFMSNQDKQEKLLSFDALQNAHEVFVENHANPPFVYLNDKYYLKIDNFSEIADLLNSAAMATAKQFEKESSYRASDYLVHYFFDLYLSLNSGLFHQESDIASAIIDGIHFKYYGQPSHKIISSQIQLWAEKERCFLNSIFSILKEDDYPRLLAIFAYYCISEDGLGATEELMLSKLILNLTKQISPKIKTKVSNIL